MRYPSVRGAKHEYLVIPMQERLKKNTNYRKNVELLQMYGTKNIGKEKIFIIQKMVKLLVHIQTIITKN